MSQEGRRDEEELVDTLSDIIITDITCTLEALA